MNVIINIDSPNRLPTTTIKDLEPGTVFRDVQEDVGVRTDSGVVWFTLGFSHSDLNSVGGVEVDTVYGPLVVKLDGETVGGDGIGDF